MKAPWPPPTSAIRSFRFNFPFVVSMGPPSLLLTQRIGSDRAERKKLGYDSACMSHETLIAHLRQNRGPEASSLDEYFAEAKQGGWNRLVEIARGYGNLIDDTVIEWASSHMDLSPGSFFSLLINLAAKDESRRERLVALYRERMAACPGPALGVAGYYLHEWCRILEPGWLAVAQTYFDHEPEGAWGILESASLYRQDLVTDAQVDWFEARRATMPRDYYVVLLSLAGHRPEKAAGYLARVLRAFPEHPAAAVEAAAFAARDEAALQTPDLVAAVLAHFEANREKAWEFFEGASRANVESFNDGLLDALDARAISEPGTLFTILLHLIDSRPEGAARLLERYTALVRRHPAKGISSVKYAFQHDAVRIVRPDLVKAVCEGFASEAYAAYGFLMRLIDDRPELISRPEVEAAIRNIPNATNYAFGFFRDLLKARPEFTRDCTLALFECLAQEPAYRAHVRMEEMEAIVAISEAAHIKTGLENALREPPKVGSRRGRALMAIMFRQKLRARRHVLLEALRYAAGVVYWHKVSKPGQAEPESEKYSPIWDFVMFIIENAGDDAVSTSAAERFLEGAFQLHFLCRTGAEHDEFILKLDIANPPRRELPYAFLRADEEIARLHDIVVELGRRFGTEPRLPPLTDFQGRRAAAEEELQAIRREKEATRSRRAGRLGEREQAMRKRIEWWRNPAYRGALEDDAAADALPDDARAFLKREKKDLLKALRDALRSEAVRIALSAVDRSRLDLYRNRLRDVLGREVDIDEIEPRILPSFLWFAAISGMANNRKYLKRLIEDRIAKRPHDWLRTEPAVLEWAEQVKKAQPEIRLDRWRAPFSKEIQYRPKDALAEKRRRIKADLTQARALLEKAGIKGIASETYEELSAKLIELKAPPPEEKDEKDKKEKKEKKRPAVDPAVLEEISMNLERVRIAEQTPDSDFEGTILLTVETDPFEILFMGEYGFASCLSLRGSNAWSAVSNAIDIDKAIVWAKEPAGNVVGRRLLALTPPGILTYRTYTNRHGLALDRAFDEFVEAYAKHCGTKLTHTGHAKPLLSDRWYDDGSI
jgi:hypothetical protein